MFFCLSGLRRPGAIHQWQMTDCMAQTSPLYDAHPPLDLTSERRRRTGMLDMHGDSSVESSESTSDVGDFKHLTQKSEVDSEGEQMTSSSTISPGVSEDRLIRVKSEEAPQPIEPEALFPQGHSLGRFMNYVHQINSMALMRQQYLHHNFPQSHLGPTPPPLLPPEILPPLAPQFHPTLTRSVSVPSSKKVEEKQGMALKPPIKDESYFERRRKNNEAAKRSRDLRRIKEEEMAKRAKLLENENSVLRAENNVLRFEIRRLHSLLSNTLNNPERWVRLITWNSVPAGSSMTLLMITV